MPKETAVYTHGHHESVLRSHQWRTAANSAAYLLGELRPGQAVLDVGCGPGTITADIAALVAPGPVTAVDTGRDILDRAAAAAAGRGLDNVEFTVADVHSWTSPTTPSTSSTPIRCSSTWATRCRHCARCGASAGPEASSRRATATTRR